MPRKTDPNVLVIDVESTCWELPEHQPIAEIPEIIEIGIAIVNTRQLVMVANDTIIVRPQFSKISDFCTKLTTLTQEQVDEGITFPEACALLSKHYLSKTRTFVSWGDYDRKMFERNCRDHHIEYPFGPRHLNLKNTFSMFHDLDREPGLDTALDFLKIKMEGTHHRGIDDAKNIGQLLIRSLRKFRN